MRKIAVRSVRRTIPVAREQALYLLNPVNAIRVYANLPLDLQCDLDIVRRTFEFDGLALAYAPWHIRQNRLLVEIAVTNTRLAALHTPLYSPSLREEDTWNYKRASTSHLKLVTTAA